MPARTISRLTLIALLFGAAVCGPAQAAPALEVYGAWHCADDFCTWGTVRSPTAFDAKNRWLLDRGDGNPSVNVLVLSFVHPLKLLNSTTDATTLNGVPRGMTPELINFLKSKGIRVMLSIGGITYTNAWNQALATPQSAERLGLNAAAVAASLGVGIEIDYEENRAPNLSGLETFIKAYRTVNPYDPQGTAPQNKLTIDLAAGDRWLIDITRKATAEWLRLDPAVETALDYANAMVPARQPSMKDAIANWREHVDGKPQYAPPIPPLAPARFTGSVYLVGSKVIPECNNFATSLQKSTESFVTTVTSKIANATPGLLGYMFWAVECSGTRSVCTSPPNTCEKGVGAGASYYNVPIPMQPLRQY